MKSKWRIKTIDTHVFGEDNNMYRLPYTRNKRNYQLRLIKIQKSNRWVINGETWSKKQIKHLLYKDNNPIELIKDHSFCPFQCCIFKTICYLQDMEHKDNNKMDKELELLSLRMKVKD